MAPGDLLTKQALKDDVLVYWSLSSPAIHPNTKPINLPSNTTHQHDSYYPITPVEDDGFRSG